MRRRATGVLGSVIPLKSAGQPDQIRVSIGVGTDPESKEDRVLFTVGEKTFALTADRAEEYAVDLRNAAIELRNGGALA